MAISVLCSCVLLGLQCFSLNRYYYFIFGYMFNIQLYIQHGIEYYVFFYILYIQVDM